MPYAKSTTARVSNLAFVPSPAQHSPSASSHPDELPLTHWPGNQRYPAVHFCAIAWCDLYCFNGHHAWATRPSLPPAKLGQ